MSDSRNYMVIEIERDRLLAENQRLRDALEEACDWLDSDLAESNVPHEVAMADRDLVGRWRAALDGTPSATTGPMP